MKMPWDKCFDALAKKPSAHKIKYNRSDGHDTVTYRAYEEDRTNLFVHNKFSVLASGRGVLRGVCVIPESTILFSNADDFEQFIVTLRKAWKHYEYMSSQQPLDKLSEEELEGEFEGK